MSGVTPRYTVDAPITYTVKSDQAVVGGQLLEVVTGGVVQPASAGSATVVGVATKNARGTYNPYGTTSEGDFQMDASGVGNQVTAERGYFKVTFSANTTVGAKLIAAANGQVAPAGATPDARTIVGECAEAGGVTAGAVGLARIY
jgi:hypothetical protein